MFQRCWQPAATGAIRAGVSLQRTTASFTTSMTLATPANGDAADVFYIRSTDAGVTFSAPFKLNTDGTTRPSWQPNISAADDGSLSRCVYDARESTHLRQG